MEPGKEGHFIVKKLRLPWFRLCLPPGFCRSLGHTLGFALALRNSSTPPPQPPKAKAQNFRPSLSLNLQKAAKPTEKLRTEVCQEKYIAVAAPVHFRPF